ncbi:hypothetical protein H5968_10055 [Sphaerospermopsis sp. LEGE 00249]|uniref:hypothetical protein n=1 Tax=Sphaerospermopsis sp. LEGE 00249 TaxID=1380707 RepID=UPI00164D5294|nr:hypothetical protein [Sphaerospermopsis sp. LEGE 00249]MBC5795483.1 hypothetical protein [Sphaerospermopsis sp. LEGE 00249]
MKNLEAQIQLLIDNAPQDGLTPELVANIAPVLRAIAQNLQHSQYYILQNLQERWVLTTLKHKANAALKGTTEEKRVVYAFPRLQDVSLVSSIGVSPQAVAKPMPVIHILFQLVALEPVDSIVFFETPGTTSNAMEVERTDLQKMIEQKLQEHILSKQVPPDIA